jgi:methyl-accepting chemotaxis protein
LTQEITELRDGAQQVAAASGQVSTTAQALSQGATEQAASLEETSASMEEMTSMTAKTAENATRAAALMEEADNRGQESNRALESMVGAMSSITESSQKVSKIIKTIDEIAFQTNILALNAAVEAARAGEAGLGFAVVADEVRSLAHRSAQAARDTASLIEESIAKSDAGQSTVQQVAARVVGITESVAKVRGLVDEVDKASRQQSQGIGQVAQAISQMEKVTQNSAAAAEESAAASEELNAQAEVTMRSVARLEALVSGDGASTTSGRPAPTDARPARVLAHIKRPAARPPSGPEAGEDVVADGTYGAF